jgi:transposase InsO family protein
MCSLACVSRAGYYRSLAETEPDREQLETRAAIQQIVLEHKRRYGYRRVAFELRDRGFAVNHKRVARLMREDNLLAIGRRKFVLTTDSRHKLKVYINLAARMELTGVDQLWVADITYIRLGREFVYLAVVLDRFSRRVVGWALDRTLAARLPVAALQQAIATRQPPPGLVHHSDRGVQYACREYIDLLESNGIVPSMSRTANPYDNAVCESFMKTLKYEEIHCNRYSSLDELSANIEEFIDEYYNHKRLHSALGYRSPAQFEAAVKRQNGGREALAAAEEMSFSGHREIYRSDGPDKSGELPGSSPAHRPDESPADYSQASCSPAELASASPANSESEAGEIESQ